MYQLPPDSAPKAKPALQVKSTTKIKTMYSSSASRLEITAEGRATLTGSVKIGYDELCDTTREGAMRWNSEKGLLEVCSGEVKWEAVYTPPPKSCTDALEMDAAAPSKLYMLANGNEVYCDFISEPGKAWTRFLYVISPRPPISLFLRDVRGLMPGWNSSFLLLLLPGATRTAAT